MSSGDQRLGVGILGEWLRKGVIGSRVWGVGGRFEVLLAGAECRVAC